MGRRYTDERRRRPERIQRVSGRRRSRRNGVRRRRKLIRAFIARGILAVIIVSLILLLGKLIGFISSAFLADKKEEVAQIMAGAGEDPLPAIIMDDAEEELFPDSPEETAVSGNDAGEGQSPLEQTVPKRVYTYTEDEGTKGMVSPEYTSSYGIMVDVDAQRIAAKKNIHDRIAPASMTKVLTLLVACECIRDEGRSTDDMVEMTIDATDYSFGNGCSNAGFEVGEKVKVYDLLCGTILPSGADAAYMLACYTYGSHEAFVEKMNERAAALQLPDPAHFTNCVGIYNDDHYCSVLDMAMIMNAAMDDPLAREVLMLHRYTTSSHTEKHPDGIELSNLFLRRIEDKDTKGEVLGAKTGYVVQSGNCAVSYYTKEGGGDYICVSADAHSAWRAIYDHVAAYNIYAAGNTGYHK